MAIALLIVVVVVLLFLVTTLSKTVKIIPQARAGVVERFGKYRDTLTPGLNVVVPVSAIPTTPPV